MAWYLSRLEHSTNFGRVLGSILGLAAALLSPPVTFGIVDLVQERGDLRGGGRGS